jgi:hypothetical protein
VPFCGDGHYHYCFDYRKCGPRGEPRIAHVDVETFGIDEVVAPSFLAFVQRLRVDEGGEVFGLATSASIANVATAISKASGVTFEDQGDQISGYRVFRARLPGDGGWAFLTPNRVKRGFVRKNDRKHASLRSLLAGTADRFPEHPDCAYFASADFTTKAGRALADAIVRGPFETKRVRLDEG